MQRVSAIMLTKNEELLIGRAIASVKPFADEILLVDVNSTDRTRDIAEASGAVVHSQDWLGWVEQRRKAAGLAKNDWLFFLDADEIVTPELASAIRSAMAGDPDPGTGFVVEREDEFLGRMMFNMRRASKQAGFVRLYNRSRSDWRSDMLIHEEVRCPGPLLKLRGALLHWRNYTIAEQVATYNRYSELEARGIPLTNTLTSTLRIVFKPLLRFLWIYVKCGNWRLGMRGFLWSGMNAVAEFLRLAKAWERQCVPRMVDPPASVYSPSSRAIPMAAVATASHPDGAM